MSYNNLINLITNYNGNKKSRLVLIWLNSNSGYRPKNNILKTNGINKPYSNLVKSTVWLNSFFNGP